MQFFNLLTLLSQLLSTLLASKYNPIKNTMDLSPGILVSNLLGTTLKTLFVFEKFNSVGIFRVKKHTLLNLKWKYSIHLHYYCLLNDFVNYFSDLQ